MKEVKEDKKKQQHHHTQDTNKIANNTDNSISNFFLKRFSKEIFKERQHKLNKMHMVKM